MAFIKVGEQNEGPVGLYFQDHGKGQPVVLIHGWPLSSRSWEKQEGQLLSQGFRVITYDRRGFGESSKPVEGYDYDTMAADLDVLLTTLDLHDAVLVGFSMGAGEVARYLRNYGSSRIARAVIISGITPCLLKTDENPDGIPQKVFDGIQDGIMKDRLAFLTGFFKDFYSHGLLSGSDVSDEVLRFSWNIASMASPIATLKCVTSWLEDFRSDVKHITVPLLVIHGDSDKILPIEATGARVRDLVPDCEFVEVRGGPHGIILSHAMEVNHALLQFLSKQSAREYETEIRNASQPTH